MGRKNIQVEVGKCQGYWEQEVVQCEWPPRMWGEMKEKWERRPEKPPGPARLWNEFLRQWGANERF